MTPRYDVVVIGAGPSGSTAAHLLATAGVRVLVIEREVFPRFHIGESLLPANLEIFDRLSFHPKGLDHIKKSGAEFFDEVRGGHGTYLFADSLGGLPAHAYQVERSVFDLALLEAAAGAGAEVHQGERVTAVDLSGDPTLSTTKGTYEARYVFDATGLDSFFAHAHKTRRRIDAFGLGAVYQHFGDLRPHVADELAAVGNIKLLFIEDSWLWAIPLGLGRLSVGLVTRRKGLDRAWLAAALADSPEMCRLLDGARAEGPARTLASFSFVNLRSYGARWSCIGDSACFLDPVFSSGVHLGMVDASRSVDVLLPALAASTEGDPELMAAHVAEMKRGYDIFATLINAIYQRRLLPDLFFTREQSPELRKGMTSILAGDIWRPNNAFLEMLWRSKLRYELEPEDFGASGV